MSKQRIEIATIPTDNPIRFLVVELYYNKGGRNYFSGKDDPRGYWISSNAVEIENRDGYQMRTYVPINGYRYFIKESARFSEKTLGELASSVKTLPAYQQLLERALETNNLQIAA
jgi:hypothetical protein